MSEMDMTNALNEVASAAVEDLLHVKTIEKRIDNSFYYFDDITRLELLKIISEIREHLEIVLKVEIPKP